MNFAAIAWILIGGVFAVYLAQIIRVWVALKEIRKLPNLVVIHRDSRSQDKRDRQRRWAREWPTVTESPWLRWAWGRFWSPRR